MSKEKGLCRNIVLISRKEWKRRRRVDLEIRGIYPHDLKDLQNMRLQDLSIKGRGWLRAELQHYTDDNFEEVKFFRSKRLEIDLQKKQK